MRASTSKVSPPARRPGAVLPLVVLMLIALFGFLALAIDLGMIAVARTQAQNMADAAATAGARTLNGEFVSTTDDKLNNNYAQVAVNAKDVAGENRILGEAIDTSAGSSQITVQIGSYTYYDTYTDPATGQVYTKQFVPRYPVKDTNSNWSLVRVTINAQRKYAFGKVFGLTDFDASATAMAAHRPRDVAIIMDLSGSMRYDSLTGVDHTGTREGGNNPDDLIPTFGHYVSTSASMRRTTPYSSAYALSNFTKAMDENDNRTPMINDYYKHVRTPTVPGDEDPAWTSAGAGDSEGFVAGHKPWTRNNNNPSSSYARHVAHILNIDTSTGHAKNPPGSAINPWESNTTWGGPPGATAGGYGDSFTGYTQGPGYYGKTFFIWPPDPRGVTDSSNIADNGAKDWRKRFFLYPDGTTPMDDNSRLWDPSTGNWRSPSVAGTDYYRINYRAIIKWLKDPPQPVPNYLQAGRILYYSQLPDHTDVNLNDRMWGTGSNPWPPTNANERFWKDYIDYVLGVKQINSPGSTYTWDASVPADTSADLDGSGPRAPITLPANNSPNIVPFTGYGDDYTWSSFQITANSALHSDPAQRPYMDYEDNPKRPRLHFWFGPMTLVDFLGNHNLGNRYIKEHHYWFPGTAHETPMFPCKVGFQAALKDIEKNHPNDHVTLIMFSQPKGSAGDGDGKRFNRVVAPLGRNYKRMIDGLWFPPYTLDNPSANVNIYDYNNNIELPRPLGPTCYSMGLMLAFNQFSIRSDLRDFNPSPAPAGDAGGLGRKGAQKLIIFETDGNPNVTAAKALTTSGNPHESYYPIRFNSSDLSQGEYPTVSGQLADNASSVVTEITNLCSQLVASEGNNGYGTKAKPVLIHCIAFGQLATSAPSTLVTMETIGNIPSAQQIGSTTAPYGSATAPYKLISGSETDMRDGLRNAISRIMQEGVQVSLLE